ncbi:hypothetical protein CANARDRAFT_28367 [[Candida] arabinofermentans NRRL YB-2248]|uniref:FAD dependent oxidoreductase domain-containing protein n=1 Tax=[Candida] arabinofermentans NRRL YB-2248 TaxID=983967 RepID=A0A1E4T1J2_9ASCO|nr:hypothetical protein CANARDRAFT_28367 [[Candida] arabinofermentans NRRL YB-2248]
MSIKKDSKIIIVGAGVFGLSNALHLAQNGYTDITVFDRLDMNSNHYTLLEGADTASADLNKVFRAQYAEKKHYQDLAFKAFEIWQKWDRDIGLLPPDEAKNYTDLRILDLCGMLRLDDQIGWEELASRDNYAKEGLSALRFDINNEADVKRANASGFASKMNWARNLKATTLPQLEGALDSTSGVLYASRACQYANYLCRTMGVKFVLGGKKGTFKHFIYNDTAQTEVGGIVTEDGKRHVADLVVINCGPWSTSLVPELDGINEGTGGNIIVFKIPEDRKDLRIKYNSKNFPMIGWKTGHSREHEQMAGMFMFPISEPEGYMKMIIRQTKYTNPVKLDNGRVVSIPKTVNSNPPFKYLTRHIVDQVKDWLTIFFPDLVEANLKFESKILWYTDTINNDYLYDYVPNKKGLFVACGGSGHAFKMLPVLGQFLVDKIEGRQNFYTDLFKWRYSKDFEKDPNGLREGLSSARAYDKQVLSVPEDYKITKDLLKSHL